MTFFFFCCFAFSKKENVDDSGVRRGDLLHEQSLNASQCNSIDQTITLFIFQENVTDMMLI